MIQTNLRLSGVSRGKSQLPLDFVAVETRPQLKPGMTTYPMREYEPDRPSGDQLSNCRSMAVCGMAVVLATYQGPFSGFAVTTRQSMEWCEQTSQYVGMSVCASCSTPGDAKERRRGDRPSRIFCAYLEPSRHSKPILNSG
jgi:hypothetical protein